MIASRIARALARSLCAAALLAGCHDPKPTLSVRAQDWPQADRLFHNDGRWLGGDAAHSVDLGEGRVLWLFGDTFISLSGDHSRAFAIMVRNTAALQTGYDPSTASLEFFQEFTGGGDAFFPADGNTWFWPGGGVRLGTRLLLFCSRIGASSGGLGFESRGWTAFVVDNLDAPPFMWHPTPVAAPANDWHLTPGAGGVQVDGDYVIAYAVQEPSHDLFLVRWPLAAASNGDLSSPAWWAGDDRGWVAQGNLASQPAVVMANVGTALSVHLDKSSNRYLEIDSQGFGSTNLVERTAPALTGPWSEPTFFYRPSESDRPDAIVYAGKAHPGLTGGLVVATYASNSLDFSTVVNDQTRYYPRFVRLIPE